MPAFEMQAAVSSALEKALRGRVTYAIRDSELILDAGRRGFLVYRVTE